MLLLLVPGYVAGFAGNLFGFRRLNFNSRLAASVPLSVAFVPLIAYWGIRFHVAPICFGLIWLAGAVLFAGSLGHEKPAASLAALRRVPRAAILFGAAWGLIAVGVMADMQVGDRVYYSATADDHALHMQLTDSVAREGVPPHSPLNSVQGPIPLRYHFFWYALCGFAGGPDGYLLSSRGSLNASVVWSGFALMCLVVLWLLVFEGLEGSRLRRRGTIAVVLLGVTGLDILPGLVLPLLQHQPVQPDLEWWTHDQVTSWVDAMLWVPHHIAALAAGMTGFLLVWYAAARSARRAERITHAVFAGVAFACAVGCSAFVAVVLAAALCAWFISTWVLRFYAQTGLFALADAVAATITVPYLMHMPGVTNGAGSLFTLGIWYSSFFIYHLQWLNGHLRIPDPLRPFIALPFEFAVEFGFFLFVAVSKIRRLRAQKRLNPTDPAVLVFGGTALLFSTFVRSGGVTNDNPGLGWRGMMFVQFLLLFWGAELLERWRSGQTEPIDRRWKWLGYSLLITGMASSVAQVVILRMIDPAIDAGIAIVNPPEKNIGLRTASSRKVYEALGTMLPATALVQFNPARGMDFAWGLYSHRRTVAAGFQCWLMGGDKESCDAASAVIDTLFDGTVKDPAEARSIASRFRIDAVVLVDSDPAWVDPQSWIYQTQPAVVRGMARAYLFSAPAIASKRMIP